MPDFSFEDRLGRKQGKIICGVDEVGRGPLAGPVTAAAVILPQVFPEAIGARIKDSKKLTPTARENLFEPLTQMCRFAIAESSVEEIDRLNILGATLLAMQRAVAQLGATIDIALIDGNRAPKLACEAVTVIKGDDKSLSIAAASIIAKVHRDRLMKKLAEEFPFYGWERNAGYGTSEHLAALAQHGVTAWHRESFAPVRAAGKRSA
ncbi:MAG: ribonuclease HII [Alphaproteobacteria bacterium]|nr:ribonuclease HII [Alphaproteobacteria bacterium]